MANDDDIHDGNDAIENTNTIKELKNENGIEKIKKIKKAKKIKETHKIGKGVLDDGYLKGKGLPLTGEATNRLINYSVSFFVICIISYNVFKLFSPSPTHAIDNDNYDAKTINPVTRQSTMPAVDNNAHNTENLQNKIAEFRARDFIDRLQIAQNKHENLADSAGSSERRALVPHPEVDANALLSSDDPNTVFLTRASNSKTEREYATHFGPMPWVVGQGKFIFGTLSTAINSDLAGPIEAVVSQDVYGEQGRHILIPQGSRLIGEYKSGLVNNQTRLFTVWTRLKEPNGIDIQLGSEGVDSLGRAGLTGIVDNHYLARYGAASLTSFLGAGAANVGVDSSAQYNSAAAYRQSVAQAMAEQATIALNQNLNIPPTITIAQGQPIVVYVGKDLDFSRVYK